MTWGTRFPLPFLLVEPDFQRDAATLADIDEAVFTTLVRQLNEAPGFLGDRRLAGFVYDAGLEREQGAAVLNFLANIYHSLSSYSADEIVVGIQRACEHLDAEKIERLGDRVRALHGIPALEIQVKAEELSAETGSRYRSHRFVCDLRPVFDFDKNNILGVYPITTLRLSLADDDNVEVTLSEAQLVHIRATIDKALRKVATLKEFVAKTGTDIPEVAVPPEDDLE